MKNIVSLALLTLSFFIASWLLVYLGISQSTLIEASETTAPDELYEEISVSDGGLAKITCSSSSLPADVALRCSTKVDSDWLLLLDVTEVNDSDTWGQSVNLKLVPRLADLSRTEAAELSVLLSETEKEPQSFPIVSISNGYWDLYTTSKFEVGSESVKALVASDIRTASEIYQRELSRVDVERIAELNAEVLENSLGSFGIRKNLLKMVLQGPMEYIILSLGVGAFLLLIWGFILTYFFRSPRAGSTVITQSSALGGSLTYLGLLGTLIGMFGTVIELSGIDFVDEMRKVYDQTGSFGSMALAIGTSVVGLTGSVIVWLSHILLSVLTGRKL